MEQEHTQAEAILVQRHCIPTQTMVFLVVTDRQVLAVAVVDQVEQALTEHHQQQGWVELGVK